MSNRLPVYHSQSASLRIISAPNGLWVYQERRSASHSRTHDDWVTMHRPTTKDEALRQMNTGVAATALGEQLSEVRLAA